ncbi:sterol desaturase family protein [Sorangium sp. So ce1097]|uniref:sterol desaturase family protein n=1 Tax=Sorangium sp. So ce1097 TaxID=3133330 RepID=UPI003F6350D7
MAVNEPPPPRARRRAEIAARIPRGYHPALHLAAPTAVGVAVLAAAVGSLGPVEAVELLAVPATLLLAFGFEWWAHRSVLHRRAPLLGVLCERHEREHHLAFTADDMALRSARELWLVLMPPYSGLLVLGLLLPLAAAAGLVFSRDAALLGLATAMGFFVGYEWLHLAYHLPERSAVYRIPGLARLREHHRRHHDPRLMKRWNFNVTVPLFDVLHGTRWSPRPRNGA